MQQLRPAAVRADAHPSKAEPVLRRSGSMSAPRADGSDLAILAYPGIWLCVAGHRPTIAAVLPPQPSPSRAGECEAKAITAVRIGPGSPHGPRRVSGPLRATPLTKPRAVAVTRGAFRVSSSRSWAAAPRATLVILIFYSGSINPIPRTKSRGSRCIRKSWRGRFSGRRSSPSKTGPRRTGSGSGILAKTCMT